MLAQGDNRSGCKVEIREGGRVIHLLLDALLGGLLLLLLGRLVFGECRGGCVCLVDDESCVVLFGIPLEACQVGLLELVILLWPRVSNATGWRVSLGQVRGKVGSQTQGSR